ncbi:MAG: oxidoreductase [Deltaproteobacteria bacterium]|jgi:formate hydrogenlyase subunit 3/multisubunit Na+/H+ antiporter MnhD subunit|nr:oxidoreductase [Deltaproteobacteria bacterium]
MSDILQPMTLPAWIVSLPLVAAGLSVMLPKFGRQAVFLTAVAIWVSVAILGREVLRQGMIRMPVGGWQAPLGIELYADGLSAVMLAITALIMGVITFYAASYIRAEAASRYFWPLWFFLWSALNALFLSGDIFNLYVTLELLGLSAVSLVAISRTDEALPAAMRYLLVSLAGSLSYLMGVALLYAATGTLNLELLAAAQPGSTALTTAFALMAAGLVMKSALFPMHFWLPPAHGSAPAPVSAALSALVVKASFYIMVRLWLVVFQPFINPTAVQMIGILGVMAIIWGSLQALLTKRLKLLVAYSTVAQIGYLFLIFPLLTISGGGQSAWQGGIYFVISHACAKAAVFLAAGNVLNAIGHDRIDELSGIVQRLPISMFAFALAGVSLIGLPPSGGFIAKWFYLNAALTGGQWWWSVFILLGGLLATAYVFRFFSRAFCYSTDVVPGRSVPRIMEWTAFTLAMCAILLGLAAPMVIRLLSAGSPL